MLCWTDYEEAIILIVFIWALWEADNETELNAKNFCCENREDNRDGGQTQLKPDSKGRKSWGGHVPGH